MMPPPIISESEHHFDDCWHTDAIYKDVIQRALCMLRSGSRFIVITDFDHTLTTFCSQQCHDIIGDHESFSEEYKELFRSSMQETNDFTEFSNLWKISHDIIVQHSGLTNEIFLDNIYTKTPKLRNGIKHLIEQLNRSAVPLLIVSAGIKNVILKTLQINDIDVHSSKLIYIDSNYLEFEESGKISSILPETPIHSRSKHLTPERIPQLFFSYEKCFDRRILWDVIVLFGDRVGDFKFLFHHPEVKKLKIGFARTPSEAEGLSNDAGCHAVLIGDDQGFDAIKNVVDLLNRALQIGNQRSGDELIVPSITDIESLFGTKSILISQHFLSDLKDILHHLSNQPSSLLFISDFDHTFTTFFSEQCHDLLGNVEGYSSEFVAQFKDFMATYGPSHVYGQFHTLCHDLVVKKSGLNQEMFLQSMRNRTPTVRPGFKDFVESLKDFRIPLLISSAGIRDVIEATFEAHDIDISHSHLLKIDANYFSFDDDSGRLAAILPLDPIHSKSKHLASERLQEFFYDSAADNTFPPSAPIVPTLPQPIEFSESEKRKVHWDIALLLGDRAGDFTVLHNHPEVLTIKIGFARDDAAARSLMAEAGCHAVLVGEEVNMEPVNRLVDDLIAAQERGQRKGR